MTETRTPVAQTMDLPLHDESSDESGCDDWGAEDCDWRMSSTSEPETRFSLGELPLKVRDSVFRNVTNPPKKTKERSSTIDTTRTSSTGSTPRDSVLCTKTRQELEQVDKFRRFWDEKLRLATARLADPTRQPKHVQDDVFGLLLKLYAHQDVIQDLYTTYDANAAEFEYYIPQLCTFLLHGNYPKQHQLECFLMSRSGESLPFAHRLTWFLRSFCNDAKEYHSDYLHLTAPAGPDTSDVLSAIRMRAGVPALLMNQGLCAQEVSAASPLNVHQRRALLFPSDTNFDSFTTNEAFADHLLAKRDSLQHEARIYEGSTQQLQLFQQTPRFVEALTDLADDLIGAPRTQRNNQLRKGLTGIQAQMLPSDVIYLPIGNAYHRVKRIQIDECFTFSTKERVPYFLCVEVLDYSVASTTGAAKMQRKRRRSSHQARVFSLQLPFENPGAELKVSADDSPVSSSTYSESEPSPTSLRELNQCKKVADLTGVSVEHLDVKEGNNENKGEIEDGVRRGLKNARVNEECLLDDKDRQERLGQWNLPQSHRRSSRKFSSSALAQSRDNFDDFYTSWSSKMAEQEAEDSFNNCQAHRMQQSQVKCRNESGLSENDTDNNVASESLNSTCPDSPPVAKSAIRETSAKSPLLLQTAQPKGQSDCQFECHAETAATKNEPAKVESVKPETGGIFASPAKAGHCFSIFSKKPTELFSPSSHPDENSVSGDEQPKQNGTMLAALFAKMLQEKAEMSVQVAEDSIASLIPLKASTAGVADNASKMKEGNLKALEFMDKDVPTSGTSQKASEARVSVVLEAEEGDAEDTDSNGCLFSDEENSTFEPEPSPARQPATSFVSLFFRKPAPVSVDAEIGNATKASESATLSHLSSCAQETESCEARASTVETGLDAQSMQQRQRDLSVSLDFADPSAWKEKFDLDDSLTNNEPNFGLTDLNLVEDEVDEEMREVCREEEPMIVFREHWSEKEARIRRESPFGEHPGWRLLPVIVKSNDDLRQEQFAAQLIAQCDRIFREYSLPLALRPYNVIATSAKTGLIEAVPDTASLDSLKRNDPAYTSLLDFYTRLHGDIGSSNFARAQRNFVESLAAYSIVCYVFQIKDRHNGNILVDTDGHVIHIDFGFLLTNSPGSNWNFERAPFKLTDEFVELMGGPHSSTFRYFRSLCIRAYLALRHNMDQIVLLVEMMLVGNADLPCFAGGKKTVIEGLRARLKPGARTGACQVFVNQLIDQSINNWRTRWYDKYQRACLGIL